MAMGGLVVRGGSLVTAGGCFRGDIVASDGRIVSITTDAATEGMEVVDAAGLLVFPGFIDAHVHSRDPGLTHKEDFWHVSVAAAASGVTCFIDMPNTIPPVKDEQILEQRFARHSHASAVDFGLWGISLAQENLAEIKGLVDGGAAGIKLFGPYAFDRVREEILYDTRGRLPDELILPADNEAIYDLCKEVAAVDGLLGVHCEDRGVLLGAGRDVGGPSSDYDAFLRSRPALAEAVAIQTVGEIARATGCRLHILHVSSAAGLEAVHALRQAGTAITAETCPHYLTLDAEEFAAASRRPPKAYPPIRTRHDREALQEAVRSGLISSVTSDHAPHSMDELEKPFSERPAGIAGVETLVPLMLNEMTSGRISAERVASVLSEGTSRIYGLYPQKGALLPGSDADFTIVDPTLTYRIEADGLHTKQKTTPWDGAVLTGKAVYAIVRGEVVMRGGEPGGEAIGQPVRPRREGAAVPLES